MITDEISKWRYTVETTSRRIAASRRLCDRRRQNSIANKYTQITALVGLTAHARAEKKITFWTLPLGVILAEG